MYTKLNDLFENVDAVLLTSPHAMRYFSGFSGGEGAVWISVEDRIVFTDSRYTEQAENEAKDFKVVETNHWDQEISQMAKKLGALRVLIEDGEMSAAEFKRLQGKMGEVVLEFGTERLNKLRMVKTENELQLMRKAELVCCKAFEHILSVIKPGITEREIAAELEYYMKKNGGEGFSFETIAISGKRTSLPHGVPTDKPVEYGDFVTMDFGCIKDGYCSDMTRTVVVGKETEEQRKIYETVKAAQEIGLEFIREGVLGKDVDKKARTVIENAGYGEYFRHSLGHGVGLLVHELPNLSPMSEIELKENMVVTCEPGIYIPDFGGVRIEDMVVVKKDGIENLTPVTKEFVRV